MTARGLRPLMDSFAGRVRDTGGGTSVASAPAWLPVAAATPRPAAEAMNLRRERRASRSSMGGRSGGSKNGDRIEIAYQGMRLIAREFTVPRFAACGFALARAGEREAASGEERCLCW